MLRQFPAFISAVVVVCGLQSHSRAQVAAPITAEAARRIDALFASWDNSRSPGCALGVSQNGTLVYARGYGMSNLDYDLPITPDSVFNIGSVSKQFTAFSIALLATDGKLSLDDDVRRYVPELPDYGRRITIRHLLTHTSGLRDAWDLLDLTGRDIGVLVADDVLGMIERQKSPDFAPGAEYFYNNAAYVLLAAVIKEVSGRPLREFADTRIFRPLGMRDTQILDDHRIVVPRRTSAYRLGPRGGWRISLPSVDAVGPEGVFTTVGDLLKFEDNFADARVGGRGLVDQVQTAGRLIDGLTTGYGFGVEVGTYRGVRTFGHGGTAAGSIANVVRFPDQHLAIAALCNLRTITPRTLTRGVADILLGPRVLAPVASTARAAPVEQAATTVPAEIAALSGTYWSPIRGAVPVVVQSGWLTMDSRPLTPLGGGRFRAGEGPMELLFPPFGAGATQELHIPAPAGNAPSSCRSWYGNWCAPVTTRGEVLSRVTVRSYSPTELKAYAGDYRSDELNETFTIAVVSDERLAVVRHSSPTPLVALHLDTFSSADFSDGARTLSFERGSSGNVTRFTISGTTPREMVFTRVSMVPATGK